jgi:hypothetical protein
VERQAGQGQRTDQVTLHTQPRTPSLSKRRARLRHAQPERGVVMEPQVACRAAARVLLP